MFSDSEKNVFMVFRNYQITTGQLLCFNGPNLQKHEAALRRLAAKKLLIKERFKGAYSLTRAGYAAMEDCESTRRRVVRHPR